jgi:hypothetical protein
MAVVLVGCARHSVEERRVFKDPLSGTDTMMRVVHLDDVEVTAADLAPSTMTIVSVGGVPVVGISCLSPKQCEIHAFNRKTISATVNVSRDGTKPMTVDYFGTGWYVWDHNGSGQPDTRVARGSNVVEIWVDGAWKERRYTGEGKMKRYYVGDREVSFTPSGWIYVGT